MSVPRKGFSHVGPILVVWQM